MKQNFLDNIDSDWEDLISDVYNDNFIFKPEYEYVLDINTGRKVKIINREYSNSEIDFNKELKLDNDLYEIGKNAFYDCSNLTGALIIPDSVMKIGTCSFLNCHRFTSLKLSNNLKEIKYNVFYNCIGFKGELVIPDSVIKINSHAFLNCHGFTSLKLSNNLKEIMYNAFLKCNGMQGELIIPDSVEKIGDSAFKGCSGFTGNLIIPDSVEYIGADAFYDCSFSKIYVPKKHVNKYDIEWNIRCNAKIIEY